MSVWCGVVWCVVWCGVVWRVCVLYYNITFNIDDVCIRCPTAIYNINILLIVILCCCIDLSVIKHLWIIHD